MIASNLEKSWLDPFEMWISLKNVLPRLAELKGLSASCGHGDLVQFLAPPVLEAPLSVTDPESLAGVMCKN